MVFKNCAASFPMPINYKTEEVQLLLTNHLSCWKWCTRAAVSQHKVEVIHSLAQSSQGQTHLCGFQTLNLSSVVQLETRRLGLSLWNNVSELFPCTPNFPISDESYFCHYVTVLFPGILTCKCFSITSKDLFPGTVKCPVTCKGLKTNKRTNTKFSVQELCSFNYNHTNFIQYIITILMEQAQLYKYSEYYAIFLEVLSLQCYNTGIYEASKVFLPFY